MAQVDHVQQTIISIVERAGARPASSPDLFVVERTANDYLPTVLETCMSLARAYAATRENSSGKTTKEMLTEQLSLLSAKLDEAADAISKDDLDRLAANGRFLEECFGKSALDLPETNIGGDVGG